ncbi:MAG: hypothetical protein NTV22_01025 [bacterium]|nr:hypothetical protein [bacterium]
MEAEIEKKAPARFFLNLIHPRREVVGVSAGVAFAVVLATLDLGGTWPVARDMDVHSANGVQNS